MANKTVTLLRRCKTPAGWRYYPAVIGKTGKVKPGVVLVAGAEVFYPEGSYALRSFTGGKTVFTKVGDNPSDALAALERATLIRTARHSAAAAGAKILEEPGRVLLSAAFKKFLADTIDRDSLELQKSMSWRARNS